MAEVVKLFNGKIPQDIIDSTAQLDEEISEALMNALDNGVPLGFMVAVLHGHALAMTSQMVEGK